MATDDYCTSGASSNESPKALMVPPQCAGGAPVAVSRELYWRYDKAPTGAKLFLLTKGGVAVTGQWRDDGSFTAWQYLFKRDKSKE